MLEVYILFGFALVWIIFATVEDLRTREIANWLNISLVLFALAFRFFYSLFELNNFSFFYQGLIGFGIFFVLGNLLYYAKMFAGGDANLMMALGAILPFSNNFVFNLKMFFLFFLIFLVVGALYGLIVTFILGARNFDRFKIEFSKQFRYRIKLTIFLLFVSIAFLFLSFFYFAFFYLGIFSFVMPYFYLVVKSVDEACMIKSVKTSKLTLGDWLYEDVKVGDKVVKATWDGLNEADLKLLSKKDKVLVRFGIQFAPVFLISFILYGLNYFFDFNILF